MPIYEFYCPDCHRVFSFLSRTVNTRAQPACPRCGRPELPRKPSVFAVSRGRAEPADAAADEGAEDPRLGKAMESLAGEMDGMSEDDPRQAARLMRKVYDAAGLPIAPGLAEALRRMEAGEDPDKVEEEMGGLLGEDPLAAAGGEDAGDREGGLRGLRRRALPPTVDSTLYEL